MNSFEQANEDYNDRFKSISDFEDCMIRGGEVEFNWNYKHYSIVHVGDMILIGEANKEETDCSYKTSDEALEYVIDGVRLRDIITEVEVLYRTI